MRHYDPEKVEALLEAAEEYLISSDSETELVSLEDAIAAVREDVKRLRDEQTNRAIRPAPEWGG